jgi:hypothetical protein
MIETLTAAAIAKLAFDAAIQAGAGKLTEAAIEKGKQLWQKIRGKVKEEGVKETTLVEVENQKSLDVLEQQVVPFLQVAMLKDPQFDRDIQNIAQQINQEIEISSQDKISINATAHDQSTVKQVGTIKAERVEF